MKRRLGAAERSWVLVLYRIGIVAGIVSLLAQRTRPFYPPDHGAESGPLPGTLRTSPTCDDIVGYTDPSDCEIMDRREVRADRVGSARFEW